MMRRETVESFAGHTFAFNFNVMSTKNEAVPAIAKLHHYIANNPMTYPSHYQNNVGTLSNYM